MPPPDLSRWVPLVVCLGLVLPAPAVADPVRIAPGGAPVLSGTGRFVAFVSAAADLVPGDTNGVMDVFVHDRDADGNGVFDESGSTSIERVDVSTGGAQANAAADFRLALSTDGRYVVFASAATNLVMPAPAAGQRIYRRDRLTGETRLVSVGPLAAGERFLDPSVTTDGRYVTFLRQQGEPDPLPFPGSAHLARGSEAVLADIETGSSTVLGAASSPASREMVAPRVNAGSTHAVFSISGRHVVLHDLATGARRAFDTPLPAAGISDDGRVVALVQMPYGVRFLDVETGRIDVVPMRAFHELADDGVRLSGDGRVVYGKCYRMARIPPSPWTFHPVECLFERDTLQAFTFAFTDYQDTNGSWGTLSHDGRFLAFAGQGTAAQTSVLDLDAHLDVAGLDARWKQAVGLGSADGPGGDPDGDGRTNLEEFREGGLPRGGTRTTYFAEGAAGPYFGASFALVNPGTEPALVSLRHLERTTVRGELITLPGLSRRTIDAPAGASFPGAFGTIVEARGPVVIERTMRWEGGGHSQTGLPGTSPTWYFAEGSTASPFELFYLLVNPGPAAVRAWLILLRPHGPATAMPYVLPGASRTTVYVNALTAAAPSDVAAVVNADAPIVVERAMYLRAADGAWRGGAASGGAAAPATTWLFAEGATGPFFETFLALANPSGSAAEVDITFLTGTGEALTKTYVVPPQSRTTLWIDEQEFPGRGRALAAAEVAMVVTSRNGVPFVAERMLWWPAGDWSDGHSSIGAVAPAPRWVVADGANGGPDGERTYLLMANVGSTAVDVDVTLLLENDMRLSRRMSVAARHRLTLDVAALFPALPDGMRFGAVVESTDAAAALVVERSTYWDARGTAWGAGAGTPATPVP